MNLRSRNFLVVVSLVLLLCVGGVGIAVASPDGDDDPGYNAAGANGFGTQYSLISARFDPVEGSHPVTTQDQSAGGAGSSVTATLVQVETEAQQPPRQIQLVRYDRNGQHVTSFGNDGTSLQGFPGTLDDEDAVELLDIRVLTDGTIRLLVKASPNSEMDQLYVIDFDSLGERKFGAQSYNAPATTDCGSGGVISRSPKISELTGNYSTELNAARIGSDGSVSGLWTCSRSESGDDDGDPGDEPGDEPGNEPLARRQARIQIGSDSSTVYVGYYTPSTTFGEVAHQLVDTDGENPYGEDLELGKSGDPYVLTGTLGAGEKGLDPQAQFSQVFHFGIETEDEPVPMRSTKGGILTSIVSRDPAGGSAPSALPALPVDLAVDSQGRPLVWTEDNDSEDGSNWLVYRLTSGLGTDGTWGTGGKATITEPRLAPANTSSIYNEWFPETVLNSLTVRPGDRVLATGAGQDSQMNNDRADTRGTDTTPPPPVEKSTETAIIAGLTSGGTTDTGFGDSATPGFKAFGYTALVQGDGSADFDAIGEPKVQSDGAVLVPHTSSVFSGVIFKRQQKIAPPDRDPSQSQSFVGVSRLRLVNPTTTTSSNPGTSASRPSASRPVRPSSTRNQCGRRVISLVRADVRGSKIRLTGLVGSKLYGKKVTIETNPTAVKASAYSRTTTVTASKKTGSFTATVAAPKKSQFKSVRYRAKSGGATSPVLKLPQSLTSRSVKSAKGTITVKGQVKRSVLGKRNNVKIRRLVCGRYRTVAVVKPATDGSYTATFKASKIRGVSFYRAEVVVQVRPGSKKYAIQYARAIAIRTTSQTG